MRRTHERRHGRRARRIAAVGTAVVGVLASLLVTAPAASAYPGAPWFEPYEHMQKYYTGNFPDPDILLDNGVYYAYGTSTGGSNMPVMSSTDLVSWKPRSPYDPGRTVTPTFDPWFNDGLPVPAVWGGTFEPGRLGKRLWAPGVEKFGSTYVAYYALRVPPTPAIEERFCISVATSASPLGPFSDTTKAPLVCSPVTEDPRGVIDPEPFHDTKTGKSYLLWKTEGKVDSHSPRIWVQELKPSGTAFADGSRPTMLLIQDQSWEGDVIENPSMIRHDGQLYLFYSGHSWNGGDYATGYALCESVTGPCRKPWLTPLLSRSKAVGQLGPGGGTAFHDASGALRLAYHYWNAPYTSYPSWPACETTKTCQSQGQRRMAITTVTGSGSALKVGAGAPAGPTPVLAPVPTAPVVLTPDQACPWQYVPRNAFVDDDGNPHERAIDCLRWWGVASLPSDATYRPAAGVTRAQMASFLAKAIENSGGTLPSAAPDAFPDDTGSTHEANVNRLFAAGVVSGSGGLYRPDAPVSRAQMATFLVRAIKVATDVSLSATRDFFPDDDASPHHAAINAAAAAGLASGVPGGSFAPELTVRRDQMASFLARVLEFSVERGAVTPANR